MIRRNKNPTTGKQFFRRTTFLILALLGSFIGNWQLANAKEESHRDVRFYKVNKELQADRILFTRKKAVQPGCHNLLKKYRVHRVVQLGYGSCSLFFMKNCLADSVLAVNREKDPTLTTLLSEGFGWYPQSDNLRGAKVRSWSCTLTAPKNPKEQVEEKSKNLDESTDS